MITLTWPIYLLFVMVALSFVFSAYVLYRVYLNQKQQSNNQALLSSFRKEVRVLCKCAVGVGRRLFEIEHEFNRLMKKQEELAHHDPEQAAYDHAAKMVQLGANVEEIVTNCGLSRAEAELVAHIHSYEEDE